MGGQGGAPSPRAVRRSASGNPGRTKLQPASQFDVSLLLCTRLMYYRKDVWATKTGTASTIPENRLPAPMLRADFDLYPLKGVKVTLEAGGDEIDEQTSDENGKVHFVELAPRRSYVLMLRFATNKRVAAEQVECSFRVNRLPPRGKSQKVELHTDHYEQWPGRRNSMGEKEKITGDLSRRKGWARPVLSVEYLDPLRLNTFVLDVKHIYERQKQSHFEHKFKHHDRQYSIIIDDAFLCIATCVTMVLNYYGVKKTVVEVCEATARFFLDVDSGRRPRPPGWTWNPDRNAGRVIRDANTMPPHMNPVVLGAAAEHLLNSAPVGNRTVWLSNTGNLVAKQEAHDLRFLLGQGMPVILISEKTLGHAFVCCGIVAKRRGRPHALWGHDPGSNEPWSPINTLGAQSQWAWILLGRIMSQDAVSPPKLLGGGKAPVPQL